MELADNEIKDLESGIYDISFSLCIYLNSGYTADAAILQICTDADRSESAAASVFSDIRMRAEASNLSFENELFELARRIKSRELLRFAMMLKDNKNKGDRLAEKLDYERKQAENKKLSEAKGKVKRAETKLCFPLMLLLVVLVIISVAPAVMQL